MMKKQQIIPALLLSALLSGCSLIPEYNRPAMDTPAAWNEASVSEPTRIARNWWRNFDSAELDRLMGQALANNNDIGAAIQRVEQARATARVTQSALIPTLGASGGVTRERLDPDQGSTTNETRGQAGLGVSYELDLFGANRAALSGDVNRLRSSEYARDALSLMVMAEVARTYFNVLNLEERLAIADQHLESARELLRLVEARFEVGVITQLDVSQQRSDLASSEANRALVEQQLKTTRNALAVLLGRAPQNLDVAEKDLRDLNVPAIAPGQPSTLLERRPDIRQAEANLIAANADIGAARAAFFPSITLGLDAAVIATPLGDPATTALSAAANILAPIFSAGRLEGTLQRTRARQAELAYNYQSSVLNAFREVEDALAATNAALQRENALQTAMNEAQNAYNLSQQQYDAGAIDFQILLDSRRTLLAAQDAYIQTKNDRLAAAVDLFRALGGGWYEEALITEMPVASEASAPLAAPTSPTEATEAAAAPVALVPSEAAAPAHDISADMAQEASSAE